MENMSVHDIRKIADRFRQNGYKETLLLISKEFSLPMILDFFDSWLYISKLRYSHQSKDGNKISFQYLVQDLGIQDCKFMVADSTVIIELDV